MTLLKRRRRAADRKRVRPSQAAFRSYCHREGDAQCPCCECRWIRMNVDLCSVCLGDMTPDPCPWCGGTGWQAGKALQSGEKEDQTNV